MQLLAAGRSARAAGACLLLGCRSQQTRLAVQVRTAKERSSYRRKKSTQHRGPVANVSIERFEYTPYQIDVPPETTVLWTNRDGVDHDVTLRDGDLKGPLVGKGSEIAVMFERPGEYAYYCHVHPFMQGKVVVE